MKEKSTVTSGIPSVDTRFKQGKSWRAHDEFTASGFAHGYLVSSETPDPDSPHAQALIKIWDHRTSELVRTLGGDDQSMRVVTCLKELPYDKYDLCDLPSDVHNAQLESGKLYIENTKYSIRYAVIDPLGNIREDSIKKDELGYKIKKSLKIDELGPFLPDILKITSRRRHTLPKLLASGCVGVDNEDNEVITIKIWDIETGKCIKNIEVDEEKFTHPKVEQIARGLERKLPTVVVPVIEKGVRVINKTNSFLTTNGLNNKKKMHEYNDGASPNSGTHSNFISKLVQLPNNRLAYIYHSANKEQIIIQDLNINNGDSNPITFNKGSNIHLHLLPNDQLVSISTSDNGDVERSCWDQNGNPVGKACKLSKDKIIDSCVLKDGRLVVVHENSPTVSIYSNSNALATIDFTLTPEGYAPVQSLGVMSNGALVIGSKKNVQIWDIRSKKSVFLPEGCNSYLMYIDNNDNDHESIKAKVNHLAQKNLAEKNAHLYLIENSSTDESSTFYYLCFKDGNVQNQQKINQKLENKDNQAVIQRLKEQYPDKKDVHFFELSTKNIQDIISNTSYNFLEAFQIKDKELNRFAVLPNDQLVVDNTDGTFSIYTKPDFEEEQIKWVSQNFHSIKNQRTELSIDVLQQMFKYSKNNIFVFQFPYKLGLLFRDRKPELKKEIDRLISVGLNKLANKAIYTDEHLYLFLNEFLNWAKDIIVNEEIQKIKANAERCLRQNDPGTVKLKKDIEVLKKDVTNIKAQIQNINKKMESFKRALKDKQKNEKIVCMVKLVVSIVTIGLGDMFIDTIAKFAEANFNFNESLLDNIGFDANTAKNTAENFLKSSGLLSGAAWIFKKIAGIEDPLQKFSNTKDAEKLIPSVSQMAGPSHQTSQFSKEKLLSASFTSSKPFAKLEIEAAQNYSNTTLTLEEPVPSVLQMPEPNHQTSQKQLINSCTYSKVNTHLSKKPVLLVSRNRSHTEQGQANANPTAGRVTGRPLPPLPRPASEFISPAPATWSRAHLQANASLTQNKRHAVFLSPNKNPTFAIHRGTSHSQSEQCLIKQEDLYPRPKEKKFSNRRSTAPQPLHPPHPKRGGPALS
jgi:hypothetical protein